MPQPVTAFSETQALRLAMRYTVTMATLDSIHTVSVVTLVVESDCAA